MYRDRLPFHSDPVEAVVVVEVVVVVVVAVVAVAAAVVVVEVAVVGVAVVVDGVAPKTASFSALVLIQAFDQSVLYYLLTKKKH